MEVKDEILAWGRKKNVSSLYLKSKVVTVTDTEVVMDARSFGEEYFHISSGQNLQKEAPNYI